MDLSIVIPAFNEEDRLPLSLEKIRRYFEQDTRSIEIIVVDDGSTDRTVALVKAWSSDIRVLTHPRNLGKGAAVRTGMLAARGEWRYLCDADLSTPIEDIERLLAHRDTADVILGSRRVPGARIGKSQAWWKVWLGQLGNLVIQALVAPGIHDTQCGFKLFHQRTMNIFTLQRNNRFGYDFEIVYLARLFKFRIAEVPVRWDNDDRSKVRLIDYFITLYELMSIHVNHWRGRYQTK